MDILHAADELPTMDCLAPRFHAGDSLDEMLASATENVDLYHGIRARAAAPPEFAARIAAIGRRWHLLVISEDWCGDAVNIVPWVDALAASTPLLEMRLIARDENLDLMDRHLTDGRTRSIPVVLVLDDQFVERAWWGPRPRALQAWFKSEVAQALPKDERYKELRTRYARDRGRTIMEELTGIMERIAAQDIAAQDTAAQGTAAQGTAAQDASAMSAMTHAAS
jgi:hypothetical protein